MFDIITRRGITGAAASARSAVRGLELAWENPAFAGPARQSADPMSVAEARRYSVRRQSHGRAQLACGCVAVHEHGGLPALGHRGTARYGAVVASYGQRLSGRRSRDRRDGVVAVACGIVSGIDAKGNPIVVFRQSSRHVAESVYRAPHLRLRHAVKLTARADD